MSKQTDVAAGKHGDGAATVRAAWNDDGAVVVRGVLDGDACRRLHAAIERTRGRPSEHYARLSPDGTPVLDSDLFRWRDDPDIAATVLGGALPALAASILGTAPVVFVEDQWFASEPNAATPSPWHQDAPYYNIDRPFVTLWVALDPAGPDAALRVVRGSHAGPEFAPVEFATTRSTIGDDEHDRRAAPPADPDADGSTVLRWTMAPGDVIALHAGALHAAGGTANPDGWLRRLSVRYAPPDAALRRPRPDDRRVLAHAPPRPPRRRSPGLRPVPPDHRLNHRAAPPRHGERSTGQFNVQAAVAPRTRPPRSRRRRPTPRGCGGPSSPRSSWHRRTSTSARHDAGGRSRRVARCRR
ncbi:MAG: phytanoyl-CoA dioxygenase family protein [Ilumatobacteraceae bacterium]